MEALAQGSARFATTGAHEAPLLAARAAPRRASARAGLGGRRGGAARRIACSASAADGNEAQVSRDRQEMFDSISPMYDALNDLLSLGMHRIWKRMTVSWSGAKKGDSTLDICCGSGDIAFLLSEKVGPTGEVVGLDFSRDQLRVAESRYNESVHFGRAPIEWMWGDALELPFQESSMDAVTMGYGLRNVTDISRALREIHRVLKAGKKCAILDFNNSPDPLVSGFQSFMLANVVVPVATQLGMAAQYEYLEPSIRRFPQGRALESRALEAGFSKAVFYEIGGGLMGVLVATK